MQFDVRLQLPRDARSVPVAREVTSTLLARVEAPDDAIDDVTLALGEACANAVLHASGVSCYSVRVAVDGDGCAIDVEDLAPGAPDDVDGGREEAATVLSPHDGAGTDVDSTAETGRGIALMHALVDDLHVERGSGATRVRLVKRWDGCQVSGEPCGADGNHGAVAPGLSGGSRVPRRVAKTPVSRVTGSRVEAPPGHAVARDPQR